MEGLIPFVYKFIVEYRNSGKQHHDLLGSWFNESPSASYIRLPGDSGRFQSSEIPVFRSDFGFSSSNISNSNSTSSSVAVASSQIRVSPGVHSPVRRRVAA